MIDLQSILGYSEGSPFAGNPYNLIQSNNITMENTPINLELQPMKNGKKLGKKVMANANSKNPYIFPDADSVMETPMKLGGNPYSKGGMTNTQIFKFLFDDEEAAPKGQVPTALSTTEIADTQPSEEDIARQMQDEEQYNMAMDIVNSERTGNPYIGGPYNPYLKGRNNIENTVDYTGEILSSGQFGSQNIGPHGKQIYGEVTSLLGYKPVVNSIYRSKAQNDALIAAGKPASKTSWHLTGNAIDLKPADWYKLSNEQQAHLYQKYDVIYHNNHYHIEPK